MAKGYSDIRQSKEWGAYLATIGWQSKGSVRIRPLLFFSLIKFQRPEKFGEKELKELLLVAKKHRALFVKVEPSSEEQAKFLQQSGFSKDRWPLLAPKTIILDLSPPLEKIKASFKKDVRQSLRKAEQNKLVAQVIAKPSTKELESFYSIWKKTGKRAKFFVPSFVELCKKANAFGDKCFLTQVSCMAGAFCAICDDAVYYLHAASTKEGQKIYAPYLCLWEVIKYAKGKGCKRLDLEGIYDPRFKSLTKKWQGFTLFKQKWGGKVVEFPGAYTRLTWFGLAS